MCSDCDAEPECQYCGLHCQGQCDDPDTCRSCWMDRYFGSGTCTEEEMDDCLDTDCPCGCHEESLELMNMSRNSDGTLFEMDGDYERKGFFPFLKLPGEVRDKIYGFALAQAGELRTSKYFKGKVDTAILFTCRQINREARCVPLSTNILWFSAPIYGQYFIGSLLQIHQRELVKRVHVDLQGFEDIYSVALRLFIKDLAMMNIDEFGVTVMGRIDKDWFSAHKCFEGKFEQLRPLKTFNLVIGSGTIKKAEKKLIIRDIKKTMTTPKSSNSTDNAITSTTTLKRKSSNLKESAHSDKANKITKLPIPSSPPQKQPKVPVDSSYYTRERAKQQQQESEKAAIRTTLLVKCNTLENYARSIDYALVKIRLGRALEAAEEADQNVYEDLSASVVETLDERLATIISSRDMLVPKSHSF